MAKWEDIAAAKRAALLQSIPQEWIIPDAIKPPGSQLDVTGFPESSGWFTANELEITSKNAGEILAKLAKGQWTSEQVTKAFCKRAAAAHQLTNCLSEIMFDSALEDARKLDQYFKETGKLKGSFHGLPISLKDNFFVKGTDATLGFASLANSPAEKNAALVDMLKEAGAVVYVKTNVPTAMMIAESVNNVFGRTVNPMNRNLTSGGSSGGESALIAFGGSCLGVGSDIGGSLRIPAACTGIFTIRPSFGRFPTIGTQSGLAGQEAVQSVNGPMARSIEDMEIYCKAVVDAQPWLHDPRCVPLTWREAPPLSKLKIGIMWDDGFVRPTPPVMRAMQETVQKLKAAGHDLVDWEPTGHEDGVKLLAQMFLADGGKSVKKRLDPVGEPFRPEMHPYTTATELGVYDMWQIHIRRVDLCKAYLDRWNSAGIDAILCPTTPYATVEHGDFLYVGYTGIFNVLDYSAVSFPSGLVANEEVDTHTESTKPLSEMCAAVRNKYNPKAVHGMPVNLQLVARRLEEEKALAMTKTVLAAL